MSYDAIGNMTKRADNLDASRTESYGYDVISQLTSFTRGKTVNKTYQFDLLGNRVKTVENGVVTNYTSNNVNAYTAISGGMSFTPSYDGNGNMLNDDKYQYNSKIVSVGDRSVTYKYDALGRRIAKNNTLFYYVGDQMVEESTDGAVTSYLYGNNIDEALQMSRKDEAYYYHTNHLGSTMGLSNKEGKIVEKVEYDVYGMPTFLSTDGKVLAASTIGNNILFTGREYNAETGDYYFRARNMHPMVGRFMQKDPLGYIDGINDYIYVYNNSINYTDAFGEKRNPVVDFLFGGCLDLPKNWKCAENAWQKAGAVGLCGLDVVGFIPGAGTAAKGAKGVSMAGKAAKLGKVANKADNVIDASKAFGNAGKAVNKADNVIDASKAFRNAEKTPKVEPIPKVFPDPSKNPQPRPQPQPQPRPQPQPQPKPEKSPFTTDPNKNPFTPAEPLGPGKEWISKAA